MKRQNANVEIILFFALAAAVFSWFIYPSKSTLLCKAAGIDDTNEVINLSRKGADVNYIVGGDRRTPLIISVKNDHPEMARLLLRLGANKNYKDANGKTAYDYAQECGWTNLSEIFSDR